MRYCFILALLAITLASCNKDNTTTPDGNGGGGNNNNNSTTELSGTWEWIGQEYLHIPSDHGTVRQAFVVNGELYCYWVEDIGAQFLGQLSHYNGSSWTNVYTDINSGSQFNFTTFNNQLYFSANGAQSSAIGYMSGNTVTFIDTLSDYGFYDGWVQVASNGNDLYQFRLTYDLTDSIELRTWNGTDWNTPQVFSIDEADRPNLQLLTAGNDIYAITNPIASSDYQVYQLSATGNWSRYATFAYGPLQNKPIFFTHNSELYVAEAPDTSDYRRQLSKVQSGGASPVINLTGNNYFLEAYSTPEGLIYTTASQYTYGINILSGIYRLQNGTTYSYGLLPDTTSAAAAMPVTLLGNNIYDGSVFFYYQNQLYALNNAHAGVFGGIGTAATKLALLRYNDN